MNGLVVFNINKKFECIANALVRGATVRNGSFWAQYANCLDGYEVYLQSKLLHRYATAMEAAAVLIGYTFGNVYAVIEEKADETT